MAFFSVIIPLYNKQESICNTVNSVLSQTFGDFELIIVNDGSTDESVKRIQEIVDHRIVFINKKNGGVSSARNAGIQQSSGEWVSFLDADDYWDYHYLEKVKSAIEKFPAASVIATNYRMGDKSIEYNQEGYIMDYFLLVMKYKEILWTSVVSIKRTCFKEVGLFPTQYTYGEDLNLWSRLADRYLIVYVPEVLAEYRINAENRICNTNINPHKNWELHLGITDFQSVSWPLYYYYRISSSFLHYLRYGMFSNVWFLLKRYGIRVLIKSFKYRRILK